MGRIFLLVPLLLLAFVNSSNATDTWCGVFDHSSDLFLNLRAAPSANYSVVGTVSKGDLLYVGTEQCRKDLGIGLSNSVPTFAPKTRIGSLSRPLNPQISLAAI
jgi:hypothetical protein